MDDLLTGRPWSRFKFHGRRMERSRPGTPLNLLSLREGLQRYSHDQQGPLRVGGFEWIQ